MTRTDVDRLDTNALLNVSGLGAVAHLVRKHLGLAERVHKRRAASTRGACVRDTPSVRVKNIRRGGASAQRGESMRVGRRNVKRRHETHRQP